ncbi:temperature-induced lipocalin-1 isoform X1 [Arachis ipaensis]|uniref:Lipocalin/cytosolic fatty-acid binding domain-containing protein n=1 Tax=Arachis hypogaea TaxID=3818 RepID=A0A445AVM3_ARAHY|nr:temperature-induced lipocalin-1 isoform X1 [Arachis ipaensis]RYR30443.1 hypothetical protein Ahy_B01g055214 isoform A [Arachis hypogaea]
MKVVKGLDVERYMGRWYEIASFPSFFQPKNGENTRATYTLNDDGTVHVLNETYANGKKVSIEGTAYKADPKNDEAKLKVKFYVPPFLPIIPVVGDYWVLYIDDDYQYAVIGGPTTKYLWIRAKQLDKLDMMIISMLSLANPCRKYLWILSRQNRLDEEIFNMLVQKAKDEGYDVSKLHKTPQSETPPEGEEGPKDTKGIWWIKSLLGK